MSTPPPNLTAPFLLGPWRRRCQWGLSLLLLLLPWFRVGGESLLRLDIANLSLHLFGQTLHIEELYLFLFFCLALGLAFLLSTLILGRVWCGWLCPQTTLNDIAEWLDRRLSQRLPAAPRWRRLLLHLGYLLLALLVAMNLLWYFIEPQRFLRELAGASLAPAALLTLILTTLIIYFDLALVRRLMCKDFCPYGRIQTVVADAATLTLHRPATEAPRCIECGACVRCCPMGIDIRQGYQVECINCGRCLDACRLVMAKRRQSGLIRYSFGTDDLGWRVLLNPKTLLLTTALVAITVILVVAVSLRQEATLKVAISPTAANRLLADGRQAAFFSIWVNNRLTTEVRYELAAIDATDGEALTLKGVSSPIVLAAGQNLRLDAVVVTAASNTPRAIQFILSSAGKIITTADATVLPERVN